MSEINKVQPVRTEVKWDKTTELVSKTDKFGTIRYVNDAFVEVSGYEEYELVGKSHNIIRHPDMPKVIFKLLWENILQGKDFHAIVKNMAKTGRYYWVITSFDIIKDDNGEISGFMGRRKSITTEAAEKITELYTKLYHIEAVSGLEAAEDYLIGFFEDKKTSFDAYISGILRGNQQPMPIKEEDGEEVEEETRKSFLRRLFG